MTLVQLLPIPPKRLQIGAMLRHLRADIGLRPMAEVAGVHWVLLSEIERGRRPIPAEAIDGLAAAFRLPCEQLAEMEADARADEARSRFLHRLNTVRGERR